ncbi:MAG: hypothetical protein ABI810_14325 [Sphingomonas bacterium]
MYPVNSKLLGLVVCGWFCCAAPADAGDRRPLTLEETQIAKAFDTAVRADATLKSFSSLPWAPNAEVLNPEILQLLKSCKPSGASVYKGTLMLSWEESADANLPCGEAGYYAFLKLKNGRVKRVTFGASQIIVTSGSGPKS